MHSCELYWKYVCLVMYCMRQIVQPCPFQAAARLHADLRRKPALRPRGKNRLLKHLDSRTRLKQPQCKFASQDETTEDLGEREG